MVMISNVDQVLALVRNQLDRMARDKRAAAPAKAGRVTLVRATDRTRLEALSNLSDLPSEEFERTLIGALLAREFGEEVAQDPRFQAIADRTFEILHSDPEFHAALQDVRRELQRNATGEAQR